MPPLPNQDRSVPLPSSLCTARDGAPPDERAEGSAERSAENPPADEKATDSSTGARDERAAEPLAAKDELSTVTRTLLAMQDRLADLNARLSRLEPWLRAESSLRDALSGLTRLVSKPFGFAAAALNWRKTRRRIEDALFRSERLVYEPSRDAFARKADVAAFARHLRRSFGFFPPTVYRVEPRQRVALAARPRILHALANVWIGGSTQLVVDLHNHLGHRFDMKVVTSALPPHGSHKGMSIDLVPKPDSRRLVRGIFSRFRPHIVHVHYWGSVDEPWYKTIFEIAAEFECPIVQNVNTPVSPFAGVRVDHNVFVSRSVLEQFGSAAPWSVIHPGIELDRFAPPAVVDPHAFDAIGMIYRLENDKLDESAIELFLKVVKKRPKTRAIIVGDGSLFEHFRSRVEQEGALDRFEFAGYVPYEDLPAYLAKFRTFVAPVRQESFGQVVPFAMRAGLAVAGFGTGALPEILESTETLGATLEETTNIVAALLDDRRRIAALGERNCAIALKRFSVESMATRYFHLYRSVAPGAADILGELPDALYFPV